MTVGSRLAVAFAELAERLGVPWEWVAVVGLLLFAVVGQWIISLLISHLAKAARISVQRWDDAIVLALRAPLRLAWWLVVFTLMFTLLPSLASLRSVALQVLHVSLVLLVPWFLHRIIANVEEELIESRFADGASVDKAAVRSTARLMRVALWVVTALMALQTLGVSVSGLLAFGGIGGIAVGFAAKDLLANFFGGLGIFMDRPFTIGDWVRSPDRSIEGTVEDIGWRVTRIRTFDKRPLYVPNAIFGQITIENPSRMLNRRIYERFGLRYEDGRVLEAVIDDVRAMLESHEGIDGSQTIIANFESFGDSSLDCFMYCLTRTTNWVEYHGVKQDVLLKLLAVIHSHGADIAFPTRTLLLDSPPPDVQ